MTRFATGTLVVLTPATAAIPAGAGCLKGAVVGAVAGHYAHHHAVLGAMAGCAIGHHLAVKAREQKAAQAKEPPHQRRPIIPDSASFGPKGISMETLRR